MKKYFLIFFTTLMFFSKTLVAGGDEAQSFTMKKTKWFPICQEIDEILRLPENKGYIAQTSKESQKWYNKMFIIPSSHKNFSFPKWTSVSKEEIETEFPSLYKKTKGNLTFEKSSIDVDGDGQIDTYYKLNGFRFMFNETHASENENNYNEYQIKTSHQHGFYYKGKFYIAYQGPGYALMIYEPKQLQFDMGYALIDVCVWI